MPFGSVISRSGLRRHLDFADDLGTIVPTMSRWRKGSSCGRCGFDAVIDLVSEEREPPNAEAHRLKVTAGELQRAAPLQSLGIRVRQWLDQLGQDIILGKRQRRPRIDNK